MPVLHDTNITSMGDVMQAIHDHLITTLSPNNWNTNNGIVGSTLDLDAGVAGGLFVQFTWTTTTITISQSRTFGGSDDSTYDSDAISPNVVTDAELWVFANDTATPADRYAHCVLEFNRDGRFIHFGFGQMKSFTGTNDDKFFDWSGGAYKYGADITSGADDNDPTSTLHRGPLIDSLHTQTATGQNLSTMLANGLRDQNAASNWLAFTEGNPTTVATNNDQESNPMSTGRAFSRYGPGPSMSLFQRGNPNSASVNLVPILVCFSNADLEYMPLGNMPDVRLVNIGNIQPKEQITLGSNDWQFFPWGQKLVSADVTVIATKNFGIAYLVVA